MELQEFVAAMKSNCSFFETESYSLRKVDLSVNRNFWYERHTETEGFRISFGWTQYGDEFHVKGLQAYKRFNIIENVFHEVKGGFLQDYYTIHKSPSVEYVPENLSFTETENNIHFVIKNQNDVLLFTKFIKEFLINTVKLFFDSFTDLSSVSLWLNNNDIEYHKDLIVLWDNTMMIRKLLIMRIANDAKYSMLYERYKNFLIQKNDEKESPYVDMFNLFSKVEMYLSE